MTEHLHLDSMKKISIKKIMKDLKNMKSYSGKKKKTHLKSISIISKTLMTHTPYKKSEKLFIHPSGNQPAQLKIS
jgi:hypothetical protein